MVILYGICVVFFFKQKTAYEMRISDWSSDVCSSDLKMVERLLSRTAFGKRLAEHSIWEQRIAEARTSLEMTRLLCLKAADVMDKLGAKAAQAEIAMIKVAGPHMALKIADDAIQAHGGAGVADDFGLEIGRAHV